MKLVRGALLCGAMLAATLYYVHAQQVDCTAQPTQPDSVVQLAAEAQGLTLIPPDQVPGIGGTFWWIMPDASCLPMPFPPPESDAAPTYLIVGNSFLVDDTGGQVASNPYRPGSQAASVSVSSVLEMQESATVNVIQWVQAEAVVAAAEAAAQPATPQTSSLGASRMFSPMDDLSLTTGGQVYLVNLAATLTNNNSMSVSFDLAGGTNFVWYGVYSTTNLASPQWLWLTNTYTCTLVSLTNQPLQDVFYAVGPPAPTMVVAWGDNNSNQCDVPLGLTNAIAVAGGFDFSLALKADGTVIAWGDNADGETTVPGGLSNVVSIAAGGAHSMALLQNGTVVAWGDNTYGATNVPPGLTNVAAIAAGDACSFALRNDGSVVAWGYNLYGQTNVPALGPVTQVAGGVVQGMALLTNGTVAMWANNYDNWANSWGLTNVPAGLSNVVSIAAGAYNALALQADGLVTAWGAGTGPINPPFDDYGQSIVPAGLSNVVAVSGGYFYSAALQSDGTVTAWGDDSYDELELPDRLTGVQMISAGGFHGLAIRYGPFTPLISEEPTDQYALVGATATFATEGEGVAEVAYQWQINGVNLTGATNASLTLTNVQTTNDGSYQAVISDSAGSVTSDAANLYVVTPPVIISQSPLPTNQAAIYQTNLVLSVVATAPGQSNGFPLSYHWQFDGTNISEATSTNYTFFVDTNSPGTYSVVVSNAAGSVSAAWQVTLTYAGSYIAPGTLAYYLSTNTVGYANGYSATTSNMLELANWTSATYSGTNLSLLTNAVWSTNCWLHGVQGLSATCIGYSNGYSGQFLVTMVSPRHYLRASHLGAGVAPVDLIAFLDTNNVTYWRHAVQQATVGNDTDVGILDADLPPSVGYLSVIAANYTNYLPTTSYSFAQGIGLHQDLSLFSQPMTLGNPFILWNGTNTAPFGLGTSWDISLYPGDSSNPEMFLINNQFVVVTHNVTGFQTGSGPNYAYQINGINQQMHHLSTNNAVGSDYQVTQYSLVNWPGIH